MHLSAMRMAARDAGKVQQRGGVRWCTRGMGRSHCGHWTQGAQLRGELCVLLSLTASLLRFPVGCACTWTVLPTHPPLPVPAPGPCCQRIPLSLCLHLDRAANASPSPCVCYDGQARLPVPHACLSDRAANASPSPCACTWTVLPTHPPLPVSATMNRHACPCLTPACASRLPSAPALPSPSPSAPRVFPTRGHAPTTPGRDVADSHCLAVIYTLSSQARRCFFTAHI
ncbi:unnamed protein product [Closterium sp. NIES-54]